MRDQLLPYYERELSFLRQRGEEFARKHPAVAGRLQLAGSESADPNVERLIESIAFLSARIHRRMDDSFPEITETLLDMIAPELVRPFPAHVIVQAGFNTERLPGSFPIDVPAGTRLGTQPVRVARNAEPLACRFTLTEAISYQPLEVTDCALRPIDKTTLLGTSANGSHALSIDLRALTNDSLSALSIDRLRFHITAEASTALPLYEILFNQSVSVLIGPRRDGRYTKLPAEAVKPIGFEGSSFGAGADGRSRRACDLLQRYFFFPEAFLGFELTGLEQALDLTESSVTLQIVLEEPTESTLCERIAPTVHRSSLSLNCAPSVNLFPMVSEPVHLTETAIEYPVTPDIRRPHGFEVHSVSRVNYVSRGTRIRRVPVAPLFREAENREDTTAWHWLARRRWAEDDATDCFLQLTRHADGGDIPGDGILLLDLMCTNRDVAHRAMPTSRLGDLVADQNVAGLAFGALSRVSDPVRPPLGTETLWRMISHLALNNASLLDGGGEALRDLLRLYTASEAAGDSRRAMENIKQINGIVSVHSNPGQDVLGTGGHRSVVRGLDISVAIDPRAFAGGSGFLFSAVLEAVLEELVSVNSFSRLELRSTIGDRRIHRWPSRFGGRRPL